MVITSAGKMGPAVVGCHSTAMARAARDITGDALWAAMMFWWVSALVPSTRLRYRVVAAITIAAAVEFAQLYRTPMLDALRGTTIGHLVLGSDFDARDLAAYACGVIAASLVEAALVSRSGAQG